MLSHLIRRNILCAALTVRINARHHLPLFNQTIFIKLSIYPFLNRKVFYSLSHSAVFYYQKKKVCNMEQNKELYEKRQKRRQDAIELKQPDMVPVNYFAINALDYLVEIRGCGLVDVVNTLTDKRGPGADPHRLYARR